MDKRLGTILVFVFILFFILFHFPVLAIFNKTDTVFNMPVLFLAIFVVWMLMIVVLRFILEKRKDKH